MNKRPHFDLPFRFPAGGHAATVEQDSDKDVINCVEAVVRTSLGTRLYVPQFGIDEPVFEKDPVNLSAIAQQVGTNEPRAFTTLTQFIDTIDQMITRIRMEVAARV